MNVREFFLGGRPFKSSTEIVKIAGYNESLHQPGGASLTVQYLLGDPPEALLIFQTTKQQTWLVASNSNLYCILDDIDYAQPSIRWTIPANRLVENGRVIARISTSDHSERSGLLDIAERKHWLFTQTLFTDEPIAKRIENMLLKKMGPH